MPRDLVKLDRDYGEFIIAVFERLCSDDGKTIAADDLAQFKSWHANKVLALERQLRAFPLIGCQFQGRSSSRRLAG